MMTSLLRFAGRHGAIVVITGVLIGIAAPPISSAARPLLAWAVFVFTFGSFLKFDGSTFGAEASVMRRNALMVVWATFGVPLVVAAGIRVFHPGPDLAEGLLFWALVPASPACVAFAAILKLNTAIALLATIFGTAVAPFVLPFLATSLGGYHVDIDPFTTAFELVVLVGGAFLASLVAKRACGPFIKANPDVMTGIAVSALFLAGLGSMKGMQVHLLSQPLVSLQFVALAYGLLFGFEIVGALLFWRFGRTAALTAALISGTRTITLAWVVLGSNILPMADLFLATGMIAKYTAPGVTKWLLSTLLDAPENAPFVSSQGAPLQVQTSASGK